MARFQEGDDVYYVPDHADGPDHPDAEPGVVMGVGPPVEPHRDRQYWVDYQDGSGVNKLTYSRHLHQADTINA